MPDSGLLFALETQIRKDHTAERSAQMSFLLSRRPIVSFLYRMASFLPVALRSSGCLLYASFVSARRAEFGPGSSVAIYKYANEKKQINFLLPVLAAKGFICWPVKSAVFYSLFYFFCRGARHPVNAFRFYRIGRRQCRRYPLFVALRAVEAMFNYVYFLELLREKKVRALVSSSDGNPHGRALMAAASTLGIPMVFVSHGPIAETPVRAKATLAVLHGRAAAEDFVRERSQIDEFLFFGFRRAGRIREVVELRRVLVCLGPAPDLGYLQRFSDELRANFSSVVVVVRPHPHSHVGKMELQSIAHASRWELSSGIRVEDDLPGCDLLVAGSSTVHLDGLVAGVPTLYAQGLDPVGAKPLSFIREGLVAEGGGSAGAENINRHYSRKEFPEQLDRFMNLEKTNEEFFRDLGARIDGLMRP